MEIMSRFERRAIEDIRLDKEIDADNYESVGRHILIMKIRKAIGMTFRKDWPRSNYSIEDILKPGNLWD